MICTEHLLNAGLKPSKRARNPSHNWVEQKKKRWGEGEKRNQDGTGTPEREL